MDSSSSFVEHQPSQLNLLLSEFQLDQLHGNDGEKDAMTKNTAMNLTSTVSTSSSSVNHPIASRSPGILKASTGKLDARARRDSKPDAASSSQGRLEDAHHGGLMVEVAVKLAATDKSQESWNFLILNPAPVTRKKWRWNLLRPEMSRLFWRIYDLPRISSWSLWNSYSKWLKSWSWIRQKSVVWPRLIIKNLTWISTTLQGDKAIEITKTKTYVFDDSILGLGSISNQPVEAWNNKI